MGELFKEFERGRPALSQQRAVVEKKLDAMQKEAERFRPYMHPAHWRDWEAAVEQNDKRAMYDWVEALPVQVREHRMQQRWLEPAARALAAEFRDWEAADEALRERELRELRLARK